MILRINSEEHTTPDGLSLSGVLAHLGLSGKPVVVELNQRAIFPREYNEVMIAENDSLEIITIAAGG